MHNLLVTHFYPPGFFVVKTSLNAEDWLAQASQLAWERQGAPSPKALNLKKSYHYCPFYKGEYYETIVYESAKAIANSYTIEYVSDEFARTINCQGITIFGCCGPLEFPQHQPEYDWGSNKRG